jgi:hypothetical protein
MAAQSVYLQKADLARVRRVLDVVNGDTRGVVITALAEPAAVHPTRATVILLGRQYGALIRFLNVQQQVVGCL